MFEEPGFLQKGDFISARWLNQLKWWVRGGMISVARDCGLTLTPSLNGTTLGLQLPLTLTMLKVTTAGNAMSGSTPGANGRGKIQQFNGTSYSDLNSTIHPFLNDSEKIVAVGSFILCAKGPGDVYHWLLVDKCANLS